MALFGFGKKKEKPAPAPTPKPAPAPETPETLYQKGMTEYAIKQYAAAFPLFQKAADQGHGKALLQCAEMYAQGKGVEKNLRQALALAEKAKSQGVPGASGAHADIAAQFVLEDGGNKKTAVKITTPAPKAEAPKPSAATAQPSPVPQPGDDLTSEERYAKGMELFKAGDYDGAFSLLKRTCSFFSPRKDKYPDGQAAMGWMYENGQGTKAKDSTAYLHYKIAATNGSRDGMAGVVRLTAKIENPTIPECQTALDYAKQLGSNEMKSLQSTIEQKLAFAQKWKEFELCEANVNTIFERCMAKPGDPKEKLQSSTLFQQIFGYEKDSTPIFFHEDRLKREKEKILFLFGQLKLVHDNNFGVTARDAVIKYNGIHWTKETVVYMKLCHLGEATGAMYPFIKRSNSAGINTQVIPTLSPQDSKFIEWVKGYETARQAQIKKLSDIAAEGDIDVLETYQKAAEDGDAEAQYQLGMYYMGKFDCPTAQKWLTKAASQKHKDANFVCGILYGVGKAEDQDKALKYFQTAAALGHDFSEKLVKQMYGKTSATVKNIGFEKAVIELFHQDVAMTADEMSAFTFRESYYSFSTLLREEYDAYRHRLASGERWSK